MTYKVTFLQGDSYSVKFSKPSGYNVNQSYTLEVMPQNLNELTDVEISGTNDKYVLMSDAASGKWKDVNPDTVLNAAASTETTQPGFVGHADAFLDRMDTDLDNKIDLDAGGF